MRLASGPRLLSRHMLWCLAFSWVILVSTEFSTEWSWWKQLIGWCDGMLQECVSVCQLIPDSRFSLLLLLSPNNTIGFIHPHCYYWLSKLLIRVSPLFLMLTWFDKEVWEYIRHQNGHFQLLCCLFVISSCLASSTMHARLFSRQLYPFPFSPFSAYSLLFWLPLFLKHCTMFLISLFLHCVLSDSHITGWVPYLPTLSFGSISSVIALSFSLCVCSLPLLVHLASVCSSVSPNYLPSFPLSILPSRPSSCLFSLELPCFVYLCPALAFALHPIFTSWSPSYTHACTPPFMYSLSVDFPSLSASRYSFVLFHAYSLSVVSLTPLLPSSLLYSI